MANTSNDKRKIEIDIECDENLPYTPAEVLDYYEEILRETLSSLEKVQWENSRSIDCLPDSREVSAFEREDRANIEACYLEIASIIDIAQSSIRRKMVTSINKHKTCQKFDSFCKNYWGEEVKDNGQK